MSPNPHFQTDQYAVYRLKVEHLLFRNFCYLVVDNATKNAALIDPAWQPETITNAIRGAGVKLTSILLTHSHFDHVNLVEELTCTFSPAVYMYQGEIDYYKYACRNLNAVQNDTVISVGATQIRAIHTPGHTPGSVCYMAPGTVFSGDTLFTEGCGVCDFDGGCPHAMFRSLQHLKATIPRDSVIYPGHSFGKDPGQSFSYLLQNNLYLNIDNEVRFVEFRMRSTANSAGRRFAFH